MTHPASPSSEQSLSQVPFDKIGAIFYGLWGFWHFRVVIRMFESAATQMEVGSLQARIYQVALHILWFVLSFSFLSSIYLGWWSLSFLSHKYQ